jgi:cell shape-determining protein MreD
MRLLSWLIFLLIIITEGVLTTLPLTLLFLLCLTVMKRQEWIFPLAFTAGVLLDFFALRPVGVTSLFFISYIFLLLLYQRKYETATMPFVIIASFLGSVGYLLLIRQPSFFIQGLLSMVIAAGAFYCYRKVNKPAFGDGFRRV